MSDWTVVYQFPIDKDLSELAQFIRRYRLPLRITEENNRQILSSLDPHLGEMLLPLLRRWDTGEISLADVHLEQVPAETPTEEAGAKKPADTEIGAGDLPVEETISESAAMSPLPSWPWRKTPLSLILIGMCFLGWFLLSNNLVESLLIYPDRGGDFQLDKSTLAWHWAQGEYWRLWTPALVHFSLPHALFNALGIWILGRSVEARAGTLPFAVLVLVSAAVSNLTQFYWSPQIVFGGMSGVVYALVGGVFVLRRRQPGWRDVPSGIVPLAIAWLLLCATGLITLIFGVGVANAAHIGGFVCGVVLTLIYCRVGGARKFAPNSSTA
ncbi:rhomboid family intramembrane serine protease [Microbulbifer marinus]|uniref:GlpG protein n=1 Tax=Microbulbifer marinus TaxID=658218 RepID=A0A1H3YFV0_9GAMM|nr:rhomboid family intramembrane serine protease [Microbulbifer marinus]SEA10427.1 GlpG protein [Microbulbifer marinus]